MTSISSASLTADELVARADTLYKRKEYAQAAPLYAKAADMNHPEAKFTLGGMYILGDVEKNDELGLTLLQDAAQRGHTAAQHVLGWMYEKGKCGVSQNYTKAMNYYIMAANGQEEDALTDILKLHVRLQNLPSSQP